jgi:hypothetical protein
VTLGRLRPLLLVALAAVLLSACRVDAVVDVAVEADGTGTITLTASADPDLVAQTPGLAEDLRFDDAVAAGWVVDGPTATEAGGLTVSLSHPFASVEEATALLQSINGPDGPLHDVVLTRAVTDDDVTTSLAGNLRVSNGLDAFADPEVLAAIGGSPYADDLQNAGLRPTDVVTFTFTADLPGTATTSATAAGTPNGAELTWTMPLDGTPIDLATTSVLTRGGGGPWGIVSKAALVALVAWCLLAAGFIAYVAKARRDRARRRAAAR